MEMPNACARARALVPPNTIPFAFHNNDDGACRIVVSFFKKNTLKFSKYSKLCTAASANATKTEF